MSDDARRLLIERLSAAEILSDYPLAALGRWRIGGRARIVVTPVSRAALAVTLRTIGETGAAHVVIGDGSNLLFDDAGFDGVVVRVGRALGECSIAPDGRVNAGAGLWVPSLTRRTISAGLGGIVHTIGIPGTLGGLVVMNGGSQRKGIGDHVVHVDVMDYHGQTQRLDRDDLHFAYRTSALQEGGLVVTDVCLQLEPGDRDALRHEAIGIMASRRAKFPRVRANCGSVFVSDPKLYQLIGPPGEAIEKLGLKGASVNDAQISPDHANFIVNNGHAHSADVLTLIHDIRQKVADASGIWMKAEVRHVSPDGLIRSAHEVPRPATTPSLSSTLSLPLSQDSIA